MATKVFDSGLTVTVEENSALRSVCCGIMVGAGSAYETAENNGISHFIEHVNFKGTERRTAQDIVSEFDRVGASFNAFTGKEYTCYYFKSIDETLETCFDVLCDLFLHSKYDKAELDRERKVILAEINMSKDDPDGVCSDVLYGTAFKNGSLGMEILGTKENVARFGKADIDAYKKINYVPSNTVVAFAGNITVDGAVALVEKYMPELVRASYSPPRTLEKQTFCSGYGEFIRDYEQTEISISFPAFEYGNACAETLSAIDCLFGSGMSSRLFQRLREKMGLVYSVYTSPWLGKTNGMFSVCANVNVENVAPAVEAIKNEIDILVRDGVTDEETEKAKMQLKVATLFGKENTLSYMHSLMRRRILLGIDRSIDELIARIEGVTTDKINALARDMFAQKAAIAYAGKKAPERIDKVFYKE